MADKKDWSQVEKIVKSGTSDPRAALVPTLTPDPPTVREIPADVAITPQGNEQGLLANWRAGKLSRKAFLEQMQIRYDARIDVFREAVSKKVMVEKTKASLYAEEQLKILDSEHLKLMSEMGIRNASLRAEALETLSDMVVAKIAQIQGKDWPESFINEAIDNILSLKKRTAAEIMNDLSTKFEPDA